MHACSIGRLAHKNGLVFFRVILLMASKRKLDEYIREQEGEFSRCHMIGQKGCIFVWVATDESKGFLSGSKFSQLHSFTLFPDVLFDLSICSSVCQGTSSCESHFQRLNVDWMLNVCVSTTCCCRGLPGAFEEGAEPLRGGISVLERLANSTCPSNGAVL